MNPVTVATVLTASLLLPSAGPETAPLKSGLQQGDYPFAYYVCDVTGPAAGQRLCYRCNYGTRPVVNIFARKVDNNVVTVKGSKGELTQEMDSCVSMNVEDGTITFTRESDAPDHSANHRLYRSLVANMITGVSEG